MLTLPTAAEFCANQTTPNLDRKEPFRLQELNVRSALSSHCKTHLHRILTLALIIAATLIYTQSYLIPELILGTKTSKAKVEVRRVTCHYEA